MENGAELKKMKAGLEIQKRSNAVVLCSDPLYSKTAF